MKGKHLIKNPDWPKTYTDRNFRTIGQEDCSFFHLSVLESAFMETQNPVLCKQIEIIFSL